MWETGTSISFSRRKCQNRNAKRRMSEYHPYPANSVQLFSLGNNWMRSGFLKLEKKTTVNCTHESGSLIDKKAAANFKEVFWSEKGLNCIKSLQLMVNLQNRRFKRDLTICYHWPSLRTQKLWSRIDHHWEKTEKIAPDARSRTTSKRSASKLFGDWGAEITGGKINGGAPNETHTFLKNT